MLYIVISLTNLHQTLPENSLVWVDDLIGFLCMDDSRWPLCSIKCEKHIFGDISAPTGEIELILGMMVDCRTPQHILRALGYIFFHGENIGY